ncbi:DUF2927 domain-containing protein [Fertoebacter nigrum]|uniref:DUF2927 domain-containing protein n=1 Tax=Fertoeibacter niger TaxID=2656921 RepID=A0A8X8KMC6_9RHOB|nr:DUF2927 domain-containing protein [Fertoeibacter niger]NUB42825.1 DUF2927 domain-containing protein [Fertoeibacter niger]
MRLFPLLGFLALAACATPGADVSMDRQRLLITDALPAMKTFAPARADAAGRSNTQMAQDFLDLTFRMESGRAVPVMTRFEGPVTVALVGAVPASAGPDLARLIARLRAEAGVDIRQATGDAAITVEFLPRARMQAVVPTAACFVVPRVTSFAEYRGARASSRVDWTTLTTRERVAIFIPSDTSPQEVRDCLHEELAQALGPLNDLYRLSDSVFNDDNFHTVLTGFDMLMLRVYYAPELRSGMTEAQVAALLPGLLARLNPAGQRPGQAVDRATPRVWINAVETALGPRTPALRRRDAARTALTIARAEGWTDARLAFSYFALGRLSMGDEVETAVTAFAEAARIYRGLPTGRLHAAHVDMQMAAFALSSGQAAEAVVLTGQAIPVVREAENAALLATLLMIRSEALALLGRDTEARAARLDSLGWARYGFGAEPEVRARMSEIALLTPRGTGG